MNRKIEKEIMQIRSQMDALIEEGYYKNYERLLILSRKLDRALNKALENRCRDTCKKSGSM